MKIQIFLIFTIFAIMTFTEAQDISSFLKDQRYVQKQIDCVLGRGRCNAVGKKIKELLPEAVYNNCRRCTPRETAQSRQIIAFMKQNYPREWQLILRRYTNVRY